MKPIDVSNESIKLFMKSMGFIETETRMVFSHKMFEGGLFDLSANDPDPFWVMDTVFRTCENHGKRLKAEEIRKALLIYS